MKKLTFFGVVIALTNLKKVMHIVVGQLLTNFENMHLQINCKGFDAFNKVVNFNQLSFSHVNQSYPFTIFSVIFILEH
jgi:hypothetical protein